MKTNIKVTFKYCYDCKDNTTEVKVFDKTLIGNMIQEVLNRDDFKLSIKWTCFVVRLEYYFEGENQIDCNDIMVRTLFRNNNKKIYDAIKLLYSDIQKCKYTCKIV